MNGAVFIGILSSQWMRVHKLVTPSIKGLAPSFRDRFAALLGDELEEFLACLAKPPTAFLRVNTLKIGVEEGINRLTLLGIDAEPLPWYSAGLRVHGQLERLLGSREYTLGYFYWQEGASMLPPVALNPGPSHRVLDLCAAPGSKTTQMAQMMGNRGVIVANDRSLRRLVSLGHNLQLCGVANTLVLCSDGRWLPRNLQLRFDRVLVDAPCTASGRLRSKPPKCILPSPNRLSSLQTLQKGLLTSGFRLLKPGGLLAYSTCSLHPEENEEVVFHLLRRFPQEVEILRLSIPGLSGHPGLTEWEGRQYPEEMERCLRVYPHDNDTDGFFIALVEKRRNHNE